MTRIRDGFRGEMGQSAPLGFHSAAAPEEPDTSGPLGEAGQAIVESGPTGTPEAWEWREEEWKVEQLDDFATEYLDGDDFDNYPVKGKKADKIAFLNGQPLNPTNIPEGE